MCFYNPSVSIGGGCSARRERPSALLARSAAIGLLALALQSATPASAAEPRSAARTGQVSSVQVAQGKSRTIQIGPSFVDLVVGDPEIADVMPLTDHSLYVLGRKAGSTNISVFDAAKQLVSVVEVEVNYNTPRLSQDLDQMSGGGVRASSANGRTVLSGSARDGVEAARAVSLARQYGPDVVNNVQVRGSQQVMLEVRFIEASRTAGKDLGVNWRAVGNNFGDPVKGAYNLAANAGASGLASGATPFGAVIGRVLSSGVQADVLVQALEDRGLARRLAEPNLITMSGERASFLAGGEFPIPVQADQGRISVDYKKFGVGLTFLPTVLANGVINLRIEPEVSQLDTTNSVRTGGVAVPALIVRRASTVIELRDGQSFAIAGLLQSISAETQQQLPWIADVPVLGALFRSASFEKKETDLAIIVTPHLVRPARPGERLRTPLDSAQVANNLDLFVAGEQSVPVRGRNAPPRAGGYILDVAGGRNAAIR
jgi:pilus assembly protein CpaC